MIVSNSTLVISYKTPTNLSTAYYKNSSGMISPYFAIKGKEIKEIEISFPFDKIDVYFQDMANISSISSKPLRKDRFSFSKKRDRNENLTPNLIKGFGDFVAFCNTSTGDIVTGNDFEKMTLCEKIFALEHEKAHLYYDSETDADAYAVSQIAKKGFPVWHAVTCLENNLKPSPEKEVRLKNLYKLLKNY